jgi:hypothetical protein
MSILTPPEQPMRTPELPVAAGPPRKRARHGDIILDPPGLAAAMVGSSSDDEEAGQ